MFESIIEEIKKIRHTNTPEKIILSKNNYNRLLAELEPEQAKDLIYTGVFGHTRIESNNYLPDGEIVKIMPDLTRRPFEFAPLMRVAPPFYYEQNKDLIAKEQKPKRKRRANFKPHMRRRLKAVRR